MKAGNPGREQEPRSAKKREKERRDPASWLPGPEHLDEELAQVADEETRFSRDAWGGRGNPQVSIRLARMMVIRGVKAILEAELRREG
jgi:hypothetical protein